MHEVLTTVLTTLFADFDSMPFTTQPSPNYESCLSTRGYVQISTSRKFRPRGPIFQLQGKWDGGQTFHWE
jgi:hypothetical protein